MDWHEIIMEALKVGGPVVLITALLSGGFIWLLYVVIMKTIGLMDNYPEQLKAVVEKSHKQTLQLQKNYQEQLDRWREDHVTLVEEMNVAVKDNTKALNELVKEIGRS